MNTLLRILYCIAIISLAWGLLLGLIALVMTVG